MPARAVAVPFLIEFEVRVMSRVIKSSASQAVKPGPSPRFVPPQLSQLVDKPPSGRQWLHEIKLDGFRMAARIDNGRAQLFTGARRLQRRCAMPRSPVDGLNGGRIVRAGGAGNEPRREAGRVSLGAPATLTGAWVP
jgi:hypothetical protein